MHPKCGKKIKCSSPGCIKSKDGTILMEKNEILNIWSEYVEDLFKDDRVKKSKIEKNMEGSTTLKEEIKTAQPKTYNGCHKAQVLLERMLSEFPDSDNESEATTEVVDELYRLQNEASTNTATELCNINSETEASIEPTVTYSHYRFD
ncbi:hypothetical protein PoB_003089800 [Plakobranchus ocellatus]|uniref:Uncharacterized protein n=1 Tax=Plakobranchus ocellatus TaxID=259542 RepID=A0AAV4ACX6_9GAST|nr:hypothetical protein PoB_003089800 [Plakobranchus ocellatus]